MLWYVRESSVAVYVTNLPLVWPLMREIFPFLRTFTPGMRPYTSSQNRGAYASGQPRLTATGTGIGVKTSTHITVVDKGADSMAGYKLDTLRRKRGDSSISLDSDERVLHDRYQGGINQETTIDIDETSMRKTSSDIAEQGWARQPEDREYKVQIHAGRQLSNEGMYRSGAQTP